MEHYWNTRKRTALTNPTNDIIQDDANSILSDYDRHRLNLIANQTEDEGWQSEKCRYLKDLPAKVTKETDIVEWWQVCVAVC
jgi:ribosomal protein L11 methylase PrmA